ncbi:MAG TPA: DoxX family protein [Verrucomicrobiae bacterium]|nr:DoxX family protein [Verrucomicrobiae bacterium]
MDRILWGLQMLLGLLFLGSCVAKSIMSKERLLSTGQTGAAAMPLGFVRFIAVCEILGAVGLVAPRTLGIHPELTPLAAMGFAIIMTGAAIVQYRIHEIKPIVVNAVLFCLCVFVAYGSW